MRIFAGKCLIECKNQKLIFNLEVMIEEKTIQECLNEVGFYDELDKELSKHVALVVDVNLEERL